MQFLRDSIFTRSDTLFGVCAGLGEDLGVNPTWFRVAFALAVIVNIEYAAIAYLVAGALVFISRVAFPGRAKPADEARMIEQAPAAPVAAEEPVAEKAPAMAQAA